MRIKSEQLHHKSPTRHLIVNKLFKWGMCMFLFASVPFQGDSACVSVCVCVRAHERAHARRRTSFTASEVITHHPTRDQFLALSGTRVLFNVINVMYAWFNMRFVSSLMLTVEHHQCLPAMRRLMLMTPAVSCGEG